MEECANAIYIKNRGERIYMNERNIDIEDMQCWVFRMAQTRWKMPAKKCAKLFKEYDIWEFIEECYDILHLNSYNCVLNDIEVLLKNKGGNSVIKIYDGMLLYHGSYTDIPDINLGKCMKGLDFDTGIWKESSEYLLDLYDRFSNRTSA